MNPLHRLVSEIHRRSFWQVLAVWEQDTGSLQVYRTVPSTEEGGLPTTSAPRKAAEHALRFGDR